MPRAATGHMTPEPPASHNARRIGPKQSLWHRPALPLPLPERSSPRCSRDTSAYSRRPLVSAQWLCVSRENNGTARIRWGEWTQAVAPYGHRLYNTWSAIATVVCDAGRMEAKLPSGHSLRSSSSACAAAAGATARRNGSARTGQVLPRSGVLVAEEYSARENWTPCAWCNRLFQSSITWSLAQNAFG
jgi:hypothetical protein